MRSQVETLLAERSELIEKIAGRLGDLCGAARHDWVSANPEDVGLHGVPIKQWREAYFEGCKDMAQNVAAVLPESEQERVKELARAAFDKAYKEAKNQKDARWHNTPP